MPLPKPGKGETEDEFIGRCIRFVLDEDPDTPQDQAIAMCFDKWREILRENIDPAKWKIHTEADACDLCQAYMGRIYETHKIWEVFPYAMPLFDNVIEPNIHPNCRCQLRLVEGLEMKEMHRDFNRIRDEFTKYYCKGSAPCERGTSEFNAWISDLGLNTSKSYGRSQEAFQWAQDMISKIKEDKTSVHYKILFAFPTESMNGNIYTESEIKNSVKTIIGRSPSLNHWEDTRKLFEEGGVKYIGAAYEDGACEAILKVPRDFVCPMCGEGKTLTSLIDDKKIVNVSLEVTCELIGPGNSCIGLEFDAPTLLTVTKLPGFPMARIFPLEKVFTEALAHKRGVKRLEVKVVGLKEQELPDGQGQCPEGMIWNNELGQCVEDKTCPEGQHWDDDSGACVPDEAHDPESTKVPVGTQAAPDTSGDPSITEQKCPEGMVWDPDAATCVQVEQEVPECPEGQVWDPETETCVAVEQIIKCPDGQIWDPDTQKCITPAPVPSIVVEPVSHEAQRDLELSTALLGEHKAEAKVLTLKGKVAYYEKELAEAISDRIELATQVKIISADKKRLEGMVSDRDRTIARNTAEADRMFAEKNVQIKNVTNSRDEFKQTLDKTTIQLDTINEQYSKMLETNLGITKRLTTAQEDLLAASKRSDFLETQLTKAKRLSKVVVTMDTKPKGD